MLLWISGSAPAKLLIASRLRAMPLNARAWAAVANDNWPGSGTFRPPEGSDDPPPSAA